MSQHPNFAPSDASREWHVTQCSCGHLTLRLGTVRMDFTPEEFSQLHRLLEQSMTAFHVAPADIPILRQPAVTH